MEKCYRPTRFEMQLLGITHRILKSVAFNIFMLILGFGIGFSYMTLNVHYYAVTNTNYEFIAKIDSILNDLEKLDDAYDDKQMHIKKLLSEFKLKISHDSHNYDHVFNRTVYNSHTNTSCHNLKTK